MKRIATRTRLESKTLRSLGPLSMELDGLVKLVGKEKKGENGEEEREED